MGLACSVGGARGTFEDHLAAEVVDLIDQAFGAERDWENSEHHGFGEFDANGWSLLQQRARETVGPDAITNLLTLDAEGRGVFLPANVGTVALPLPQGGPLRCASLTGLRRELFDLAERWSLPVDDEALTALLHEAEHGGTVADPPEVLAFARLMLAANEAMRRDCPLWLVS